MSDSIVEIYNRNRHEVTVPLDVWFQKEENLKDWFQDNEIEYTLIQLDEQEKMLVKMFNEQNMTAFINTW